LSNSAHLITQRQKARSSPDIRWGRATIYEVYFHYNSRPIIKINGQALAQFLVGGIYDVRKSMPLAIPQSDNQRDERIEFYCGYQDK
jgi:hypothetical protein